MKYNLVGLGVLFLLCWMGCCPPTCRSAEVWTDDFNDGTYHPEWTIVVNPNVYNGQYGFNGSFWDATNQYLQMLPSPSDWGSIGICRNAANGTWSFDIQFNLTDYNPAGTLVIINFMSNDVNAVNDEDEIADYRIAASSALGDWITWSLGKHIGGNQILIASSIALPVPGWHHIDVTRTPAGEFSVYLNDSLIIQDEDQDITTSGMFWCWNQAWQMIDNITLPDVPAPCSRPPDIILIVAVVAVAVIVIVLVVFLLRRRRS